MDKETIEEFSRRYKSVQRKLSIVVAGFIMLLGAVFLGVGIYFAVVDYTITKCIIGCIMCTAGVLNVFLGIKFFKFTRKNLEKMPAREAAVRYSRITGKKEFTRK